MLPFPSFPASNSHFPLPIAQFLLGVNLHQTFIDKRQRS